MNCGYVSDRKIKRLCRVCPICRCEFGIYHHTLTFVLPQRTSLPNKYDLVSCEKCGFVFADTSAQQKDYDVFYAEQSKYEDVSVSSGGYDSSWDRKRFDAVVGYLEKYVSKESTILDVGCANGGLLLALRDANFKNLVGIDPSRKCVENVCAAGLDAQQGGLFVDSKLLARSSGFEGILLSHVLEHVRDLAHAVAWVRNLLAADGLVYVEVPDASRYAAYYKIPYYYFDCEHINHFDPVSLKNLFFSSGFELCDLKQREIPVSVEDRYPVIAALFKVSRECASVPPELARDAVSSIQSYLARSAQDDVFATIDRLVKRNDALMIWGAGQYALRLLATSRLGECNIVSFIDKDQRKQGSLLGSIPVCPPDALRGHRGPIVICSALHSIDIESEIRGMGLDNEVVVLKGAVADRG